MIQSQDRLIGFLSTAGVKTAELCLIYEKILELNSIHVTCPICFAALGAKCIEKKNNCLYFIENFHEDRVEAYFRYMEAKCRG